MPLPPLKPRQPNNAVHRLQRELDGTKLQPGPVSAPSLVRYKVDELDPTLSLRRYTIVGEQTTYPYHLITLPKFQDNTPVGEDIPYIFCPAHPPNGRQPAAGITYWVFDANPPRLTIANTTQHRAPAYSNDLYFAHTAWQNSTSQPLQVLIWSQRCWSPRVPLDFPCSTPLSLEFRCGRQSVQLEKIFPLDTVPGVCFGDVTSTAASTIKMLHSGTLFLYEPCGGDLPPLPDTAAWTTLKLGADITVAYDLTDTNSPITTPRVRTLSLVNLAGQFLRVSNRIPRLVGRAPVFHHVMHLFLPTKQVRRTKPGVITPHTRTLIAFGAAEKVTEMFHLLVFTLSLPSPEQHPRVTVVVAKAFGVALPEVDDDEELESSENMQRAWGIFHMALIKSGISTGRKAHDCEHECPRDEVSVRKTFEYGKPGLQRIVCEGMGAILEGWTEVVYV